MKQISGQEFPTVFEFSLKEKKNTSKSRKDNLNNCVLVVGIGIVNLNPKIEHLYFLTYMVYLELVGWLVCLFRGCFQHHGGF